MWIVSVILGGSILIAVLSQNPTQTAQNNKKANVVAEKSDWYVISNIDGKCKVDEGPAALIRNLQVLKETYKVEDIKEKGQIVKVIVMIPHKDAQVIYFKGLERCQMELKWRHDKEEKELEKYK